ncbi:hypothetical protein M408DRAFT_80208 [Serendipita vermifera MAFF 305830]|uniref:DDE-1 domain-containing protein n=1 Tax=Serendipita vermifera MAFF 305830 TaxID=933852 RepID=A0A0C3ANS3_SERVB|nr:hypothetical protein M408DRAFT_80208 [Serendipita vermifera MAFF 305830]
MSATPAIMKQYFDCYKSVVGEHGEKIPPHRQFAYDESGVLRGHSQRACVIAGRKNKAAKVNKGGSRELITFIPVISATGHLLDSLVIFPGKLLRRDWIENNPGKYAHSFMNNTLRVEFIQFFHNATCHLEPEGPWLLHVDCHALHINLPLIEFAHLHNIIVFGYPPHTTHLLQGLDVVMFSPFKNAYAKCAAEHLKQRATPHQKPRRRHRTRQYQSR